jgi:hypothetical protein
MRITLQIHVDHVRNATNALSLPLEVHLTPLHNAQELANECLHNQSRTTRYPEADFSAAASPTPGCATRIYRARLRRRPAFWA